MSDLTVALAPAFAAGFAVQRILEILDSWFDSFKNMKNKKLICNIISLLIGLLLAIFGKLHVLGTLSGATGVPQWLDVAVSGLVVSGGTEGLNSIMKFLNYKKEEQKTDTADKKTTQTAASKTAAASM
ncbi:MAG TPA: hypothetical protein VFW31_18695 [Candidatus Angelobacter sp.]|nr:hypothetical protein [Candidatus Angelobacter sp.]